MDQGAEHAGHACTDDVVRPPADAEAELRRILTTIRVKPEHDAPTLPMADAHQHGWEFLQALPAMTENPGPTLPDRLMYSCTCGAVRTTYVYHGLGGTPSMRHEVVENPDFLDRAN